LRDSFFSASAIGVHNSRFQIEEMVSQDANGATFLATDLESGRNVLLQRFFPFGAGSGGLEGEERNSYQQGVELIKQLEHPALRRVLDGGCDPVDGIPYLISEARVDVSLAEYFSTGQLSVNQGRYMVEQALALVLQIESVFGVGADWLVFAADDIEVGGEGETFRFSVDPMKWLGLKNGPGVVKELAATAENALGWAGRIVAGSTMGTLQGWVRAGKAESMTVAQAWDVLHGAAPPSKILSTAEVVSNPTATAHIKLGQAAPVPFQPPLASAKSSNKGLFLLLGTFLIVAALATAVVMLWQQKQQAEVAIAKSNTATKSSKTSGTKAQAAQAKPKAQVAQQERAETSEGDRSAAITQRALELQGEVEQAIKAAPSSTPRVPIREEGYQAHETTALREQIGRTVMVMGKVQRIRTSGTGKSVYVYVEFEGDSDASISGRYLKKLGKADMEVKNLESLIGKQIHIKGMVLEEFDSRRLLIDLEDRSQITEP
jgi:hypothetical protein